MSNSAELACKVTFKQTVITSYFSTLWVKGCQVLCDYWHVFLLMLQGADLYQS